MASSMDGSLFGPDQPCFGCSPTHPMGFRLRFEKLADGVRTQFMPNESYQGPPGIMHGGLVMTLADEVGAWALIATKSLFGFTTEFQCTIRRPIRIGQSITAQSQIVEFSRRSSLVRVSLEQAGQQVFEAQIRFVCLSQPGAERLLQMKLPERWQKFTLPTP